MKQTLLLLFVINTQLAFAQDLLWAKVLNNSLPVVEPFGDEPRSIAVDGAGNVYVTGNFQGTVDFDPGAGTQNLSSAGGSDIFIAKYDAGGNYIFAKRIGGIGENDVGYSLALDELNNIYLTGSFGSTVDFDPGAGIQNLISTGSDDNVNDIFIAKYDASGNYIFAKSFGSTDYDHAYSITVDVSHNIYITGYFGLTVDFDPGAGMQNLTSVGGSDIFFAKYDASGNYVFAKSIGGIVSDVSNCIVLDNSGNFFITGHFSFTADFDPGPGIHNIISNGNVDMFIAKYNAAGNFIFANGFGNSSLSSSNAGRSLSIDADDNVYITGEFDGTVDFDPGPASNNLVSGAGSDIYFAKYDAAGNYIYAKDLSGTGFVEGGIRILTDGAGNVLLTGYFNGNVDFDPNSGVQLHNSAGGQDIFLAGYDGSGNYSFSKTMGNTGSDDGWDIARDLSGNIYLTGNIEGIVNFDPTTQLTANNNTDIFIAKYGPLAPLPVTLMSFTGESQRTINKLFWTTATEINNVGFEVQRSFDGVNFSKLANIASKAQNGNSITDLSYRFDDLSPLPDKNYYKLKQIDIDGKFNYSKVILIRNANPNTITAINIYPNPAAQKLNVRITFPIEEKVTILVTDLSGKVVMQKTQQVVRGDNQIPLQIQSLNIGTYIIKAMCSNGYESPGYKFIKQ
jgi:hypothetical protein